MKKLFLFAGFAGLFLILVSTVFADSGSVGGSGNTVQIMDNNEVQMVDEVITIDVYDGEKQSDYGLAGRGYVEVEVVYNFLNTTDSAVTVKMGFPEDCGWECWMDTGDWEPWGDELWESYKLFDFEALDGGSSLDITFRNELEAETEYTNWYLYDVDFEAGEEKEITNTYWMMPSFYKMGDWFYYILETGASWKGVIEQVDIYVNFHGDYTLYGVSDVSPSGYMFDVEANAIEWHLEDLEPTADDELYVLYASPSEIDYMCLVVPEEGAEGDASSYLPMEETSEGEVLSYYPCRASDGDPLTSWVEGASGDGVGEWVRIDLDSEKAYYGLNIFAGYGESEDLWGKNGRVKKVRVDFSNGGSEEFDLADVYEYQDLVFDAPVSGLQYADIEILEVYEGSEYDDTALAEIQFYGLLTEGVSREATVFSDITSIHPNSTAILYLEDVDVIDGYPDGSFKPNGSINRAELMKMVVEMMVGDPAGLGDYGNCFSDVGGDWYAPHVCYAYEQGWVDGYPDGTFKPADQTNRAEAIKIILNAYFDGDIPDINTLDLGPEYHVDIPNDADEDAWYYSYVEYAALAGVLDLQHIETISLGYNYFPGGEMTRKEVAQMIYNLMNR